MTAEGRHDARVRTNLAGRDQVAVNRRRSRAATAGLAAAVAARLRLHSLRRAVR
jgi:hypothetical protein